VGGRTFRCMSGKKFGQGVGLLIRARGALQKGREQTVEGEFFLGSKKKETLKGPYRIERALELTNPQHSQGFLFVEN